MILVIAEMAMSGVYPNQDRWIEQEKRRHLITPELTAQGSSGKVWLQENGKLALYKTSRRYGENPLIKTIVVDYLVSNPDRHPCNWGFFMNNKTGEIVGMHPLLDFNRAFDEKCMKDATDIECRMMPDTSMKDAALIAIQRCDFRCTKPITRDMFFTDNMYKSFMSRAEELGLYRQQEQKREQKHEQKREHKSLIKRLMNRDKSQGEQMPSIVVKDNTHEYWQWVNKTLKKEQ